MTDSLAPRTVSIKSLRESRTNPRKTLGSVDELTQSIRSVGVLQPLLARPVDDGLELVFGHRRMRAAIAAGLKEVPVIIRKMSDMEALEAQLVENSQRVDIHPMEEAEGYERLRTEFKKDVEQIAEMIGKSASQVYARLKLVDLVEPARKAFYKNEVDATVAVMIARLQGERLQMQALAEVTKKNKFGDRMSKLEAARYIQENFGKAAQAEGKPKPSRSESPASERRVRELTVRAALDEVVRAIEAKKDLDENDLRLMVLGLGSSAAAKPVLDRRGYESEKQLMAGQKKMDTRQLRGLLFELAVAQWAKGDAGEEYSTELKALCRAFGMTLSELERGTKERLAEQAVKDEAESLFRKPNRKAAT